MVTGFIYITTNHINNRKYIGQYSGNRKNYLGSGKLLKQAIKKYGKENFSKEIIEYCNSRQELNEAEIKWIKFYNAVDDENFYNIASGGMTYIMSKEKHPLFGKQRSEEVKEKISKNNARKGKPGTMLNKHHTSETIEKLKLIRKLEINNGKTPKNKKKVICIETNIVYNSIHEAANNFDNKLNAVKSISAVCNHKQKTFKGFTYKFL